MTLMPSPCSSLRRNASAWVVRRRSRRGRRRHRPGARHCSRRGRRRHRPGARHCRRYTLFRSGTRCRWTFCSPGSASSSGAASPFFVASTAAACGRRGRRCGRPRLGRALCASVMDPRGCSRPHHYPRGRPGDRPRVLLCRRLSGRGWERERARDHRLKHEFYKAARLPRAASAGGPAWEVSCRSRQVAA